MRASWCVVPVFNVHSRLITKCNLNLKHNGALDESICILSFMLPTLPAAVALISN